MGQNIFNLVGRISEYYRLILIPLLLGIFALYLSLKPNAVMFCSSIGFFITTILVAFILIIDFFKKLSDGTRDFIVSIAQLVYTISLMCFLYVIEYYLIMKLNSVTKPDKFWISAAILMTFSFLFAILKYYRWLFSDETIPYIETSHSSAPMKLKTSIAIISDTHINVTGAYESKTPLHKVCCELKDELEKVKNKADYILFLGDMTDTGRREEWQGFKWAIKNCDREKVLIIPGNHDLTFCTNYISRINRVKNFIDYIVVPYYGDKKVLACNNQTVNEICESYKLRRIPRWEKCMDDLYPMILFENKDAIFVALNSSTIHGFDMISNGIGEVKPASLDRLKLLNRPEYKGKVLFLALHNHVCFKPGRYDEIAWGVYGRCPDRTKDWSTFKKWKNKFQTKGLKMVNSKRVMDAIIDLSDNFNRVYVLHGHLHRQYEVNIGKVSFFSAPSFMAEEGEKRKERIPLIDFRTDRPSIFI